MRYRKTRKTIARIAKIKTSAAIFGVGPRAGLGAELCHKAARAGYHVYVSGRTQDKLDAISAQIAADGGSAQSLLADVTDAHAVADAVATIGAGQWPLELAVYNAGNNFPQPFLEVTAETYESMWRVICFGAFLVAQSVLRLMLEQGAAAPRRSLLFTGASGSLRGRANFAAFASGKGALRMLTQSLAREFGPQNIHIAHVIIDGVIRGEKIESRFPEYLEKLGEDGALTIGGIADAFMMLHAQARSAWTQELDLRPYKETF